MRKTESQHLDKDIKSVDQKQAFQRQCVGCRQTESPLEQGLERFVHLPVDSESVPHGLVFDIYRKLPGRGAYLHVDSSCVESALKSGFRRSFKIELPKISKEDFFQSIYVGLKRRISDTIRAGFRSDDCYVGESSVAEAIKNESLTLLVIASDAGAATHQKYSRMTARNNIKSLDFLFSKAELGALLGRDSLALIGFRGNLAIKLSGDVTKISKIE